MHYIQDTPTSILTFYTLLLIAGFVIGIIAADVLYPPYIGIKRRQGRAVFGVAFLLAMAVGAARWVSLRQATDPAGNMPMEADIIPIVLCAFLFVMAAVAFAAKLYVRLVAGQATALEKAPGMAGLRAWLGIGNLNVAALVTVLGWAAFGFSVPATFGICVALLAIYPLLNFSHEAPKAADNADLAASRERILQMLADGKITADDSAGLLTALGTSTGRQTSSPPTPGRKLVLLGAALVLLGFFFPWFSFNLQKEMQRQASQLGVRLPSFADIVPQFSFQGANNPGDSEDFMSVNAPNVNIASGDIKHGLGWLVLALAIGAAALPYIAPRMDRHTQRTLTFLALGVGAVVLAYLLSQMLRMAAIGIVFAALGYVCALVGELKDAGQPA